MDHSISNAFLSIEKVAEILQQNVKLSISAESLEKVKTSRSYLDAKVKDPNTVIYGVNTGFGALCNVRISEAELEQLQYNLLISHACGMGDDVPADIVKIMLLLKVQSLSYGFSGIDVDTLNRLVELYNQDILPVVYEQGSLGASGDLSPLAHLCLPLIGLGEVMLDGQRLPSSALNYQPLHLKSKEGLALLNGTQFMSAYGVYILIEAQRLWKLANSIACLSLEAYDCRPDPFDERLHAIRPHAGQLATSAFVRDMLNGSTHFYAEKPYVQDPYSFRCIPQVHGASYDVFKHVQQVFETEINAVTDNPNIFAEDDKVLSGGNFHGQPLAMALDYLAIALAELGAISERRTYLLISGTRNLPPFLAKDAGLNSGFMIPQYTAASIVSQNKQLCTPASIDSIPSSNGQEDHVSMGANAATKCFRVLQNLQRILGIEMMTAAQAYDFRKPIQSSTKLEAFYKQYRAMVPFQHKDAYMHEEMEKSLDFVKNSR